MDDCKIRSGYRVIGHNAFGGITSWYFGNIAEANDFARSLAQKTGEEVDVCQYLGSWRMQELPVEFVPAKE